MDVFLVRSAESDSGSVTDPYSAPLTARGRAQAKHIGQMGRDWDVQFLCASTMRRAQDTADILAPAWPQAVRWDVQEIEDVNVDDLMGDPTASHLTSTWSDEQRARAGERVWIRTMAALVRIQIYAEANGLSRVAIVSHALPLQFLLLNWLGHDWQALNQIGIALDHGSASRVLLGRNGSARIEWINRS